MQTRLADFIRDTPDGRAADAILRKCVHCGFCTATCPTYQLLGDELDGPRGRIYLIKELLEGAEVTARTRTHLDRCLTCRACETTCPSGVRYGRLADIGRRLVEEQVPRPFLERIKRRALLAVIPHRARFAPLLAMGRLARPFLPNAIARKVPPLDPPGRWPAPRHGRRMLALGGCAQGAIAPGIDTAAARVLDRLGISYVPAPATGCCGAASHHLGAHDAALAMMRRNIDAWWPEIEAGAEAVVVTASACAGEVKEYAEILGHDPAYADKAARVSALARDLSEVVAAEDCTRLAPTRGPKRVAFHSPCTLQHGQKIRGVVEGILERAGFELTAVADAHLCCGSAGTYSILQPKLSRALLLRKIDNLEAGRPEVVATANIGCYAHLGTAASVPVRHWIQLLDPGDGA